MTKKELWDELFRNDWKVQEYKLVKCTCCDYEADFQSLLHLRTKYNVHIEVVEKYYICKKCFVGNENNDLRDLLENFLISDAISEEDKNKIEKILGDNNG